MVLTMNRWKNKIAIVTGASSGIGAEIAKKLAENGLKVVGLARRMDRLEQLSKSIDPKKGKLYPLKCDVTKEEDIETALNWIQTNLGAAHILINNAGLWNRNATLLNGEYKDWLQTFEINVLAICLITKNVIKTMMENNINGHIININSTAGHKVVNAPGVGVYPPSKYAVTALSEVLKNELMANNTKIKVTSISPGMVATEMTVNQPNLSGDAKKFLMSLPCVQPEDIAEAAIYALSTPEHVQIKELTIQAVGEKFA